MKIKSYSSQRKLPGKQTGAVLIIGLMFLVVLTIIVVSSLRSATLQERMAANARNQEVAFQAAEAMLEDAASIFNAAPFSPYQASKFSNSCDTADFPGLCKAVSDGETTPERWIDHDWDSADQNREFSSPALNLNEIPNQPKYFVEIITPPKFLDSSKPCELGLARITARGIGNNAAEAKLEMYWRFRASTCRE